MKYRFNVRTAVWIVVAAIAVMSLSGGVDAVQGDKKFRLLDDCDPTSFNAVLGAGACVGNGHTTFDEFINELVATQDAHKWRNQPSQALLNIGRPTLIENRGGEDHTFTEVAEFGGGFVDALNGISGNPVPAPECLGPVDIIHPGGVEQGPTAGGPGLSVGTHKFQCCIHPWMRTVVEVSDNKTQGGPPAAPSSEHHH
jgi:hypothetical protein